MWSVGVLSVIVVLFGVGITLWSHHPSESRTVVRQFATAAGQRAQVQLAEGVTMTLGPATSARVSLSEITVIGEAYFSVVPHVARPVVVRTRSAELRVLGTRFTVQQYPEESSSQVAVEEGRVAVHRASHSGAVHSRDAIVSARMVARVSDSTIAVTSDAAIRAYTAWTSGTLVFSRVPLERVVAELSRAYAADIRVTDSVLAGKTVIMELDIQRLPLAQMLDVLGAAMEAHCQRDGTTYVLYPGRGAVHGPAPSRRRDQFPQPEKHYGR